MDPLTEVFEERIQEIDAYLDLLEALDRQAMTGRPEIGDQVITARQQRILYSSVYLQLYNLVEATANWCVNAVSDATSESTQWKPKDLDPKLRREWVRTTARTHVNLNYDKRLNQSVAICDILLGALPISDWEVEKRGGGNWDDYAIEKITDRIGCELRISASIKSAVKRPVRDDKNSLGLVKDLRNKLAHGVMSFEQCGTGVTVSDLRDLKDRTADYLGEVVKSFRFYIDNHLYLAPEVRPAR